MSRGALRLAARAVAAGSARPAAYCIARSVNAIGAPPRRHQRCDDTQALGVDMADGWKATTERFLQLVSKRTMLASVREANGTEPSADLFAMKKAPLALHCARPREGIPRLPAPLRPHDPDVRAREGEHADADIDEEGGEARDDGRDEEGGEKSDDDAHAGRRPARGRAASAAPRPVPRIFGSTPGGNRPGPSGALLGLEDARTARHSIAACHRWMGTVRRLARHVLTGS